MDGHDDHGSVFLWDAVSDVLGAAALGVLFLAAWGLPHLI